MYLPDNKEDRVRYLVDLYHKSRDDVLYWREKAIKYYRLYNSYVNQDEYPLRFKIFYPVCFSVLETIMPRIVQGLLFRHPIIQLMKGHPLTQSDAVVSAERLVNKWLTDAGTWTALLDMVKEGLIVGTSAAKIQFIKRKRVKEMKRSVDIGGVQVPFATQKITENIINRPMLIHRDMFDVYPDINHPMDSTDLRYVFDVYVKPFDEIKYGDVEYENLDLLEAAEDWTASDYYQDSQNTNTRLRITDRDPDTFYNTTTPLSFGIADQKPRFIMECTWREWTEEGEVIHLITIGNERFILRDEIIPVWPWVFFRHNPLPGEFLGRSLFQPLESLQFGINDVLNMNLDNMLMALTKLWFVGEGAEIDLDQLVLEPMGIVQCADINQVKSESFADLNPASMRLEETLMTAIQQASGITDFLRGATPQRREVATTVLALQQAAEARFDTLIKFLEKTWLGEIGRIMIEVAQNELDEPEMLPNKQDPSQFDLIDMYKIQGLFEYKLHASAVGMKELQRTAITDYANNLGQLLGQELPISLRAKIAAKLASTYDGLEELQSELEQFAAKAELTESQGGGSQAGPGGQQNAPQPQIPSGVGNFATALKTAENPIGQKDNQLSGVESHNPVL